MKWVSAPAPPSASIASIAFALALTLASASARAADPADVAAARDAYDRGAASYDAGEFALAAQQLSKADSIVANDVALELALRAAVKANDALLAMDLCTRADTRQSSAVLIARDEARAKMGPRAGRVLVTCAPSTPCTATFDDAAFPVGRPRWVLVGEHHVIITSSANGERQAFRVRVDPLASIDVVAAAIPVFKSAPAPRPSSSSAAATTPTLGEPPPRARPASDVSPVWFYAGLGVTALLGGVSIASAVDTRNKHEAFQASPSASLSNDGENAQTRTNVLMGATIVSAAVTAGLGLFVVHWGGKSSTPPPSPSPSSAQRETR